MAAPSRSNYGMGSYTAPKSGVGSAATTGGLAMINPLLAAGKIGYDLYAGYRAGKARSAMARYNADMIEQEAGATDMAMKEQGRRLAEGQRGIKATQRMSVAGRGGLMGGTDLLTLADEAEKMQLDQLELMRQRKISKDQAAHSAYLTKFEAEQAEKSGLGATLGRSAIFNFRR